MKIEEWRKEIDAIDEALLELFIKRMELARKIAGHKKESGAPVLNPEREAAILDTAREKAGRFSSYANSFFLELLRLSRSYQDSYLHEKNEQNEIRIDR